MAGAQEGLRQQLDQLRQQMGQQGGQAGQALDRAEKAMRDAVDALGRGQGQEALGRQGEALDQLHEAARAMADQMQDQDGDENGPAAERRQRSVRPRALGPAAASIAATCRSRNSRRCRKAARSWTSFVAARANAPARPRNAIISIGCCMAAVLGSTIRRSGLISPSFPRGGAMNEKDRE